MKSVLLLSPWVRRGGAETLLLQLAYHLRKQGMDVTVLCLYVDSIDLPSMYKEIRYSTPHKVFSRWCRDYRWFRAVFGTVAFFINGVRLGRKYDIINAHNSPSHWVAAICSFLYHKPIVWTCNEPPAKTAFNAKNMTDFIAGLGLDNALDRYFVRKFDSIIVLDRKNQERVRSRYGMKSTVVNSGVDFQFFGRQSKATDTELEKRVGQCALTLLTVGTLTKAKNQILAIRALEVVKEKVSEVCLVIGGGGPERKNLEEYVQAHNLNDQVYFAGKISNEELRGLYNTCDVLIFPAINQSWGLTPLEALCCRKLSVVSSDAGISEVLKEHGVGFVAEPHPSDFGSAIVDFYHLLTREKQHHELMVQKGFELVRHNYTWERYAKSYREIFEVL